MGSGNLFPFNLVKGKLTGKTGVVLFFFTFFADDITIKRRITL